MCVCSNSKQKTGAPEVLCTLFGFSNMQGRLNFQKKYSTLCVKSCTGKGTAIHITTVFTLKQTCTCGVMPLCFISKRFDPNTVILAHHALDVPHQTFNLKIFKHMTLSKMWCCFFFRCPKVIGMCRTFFPQPYVFSDSKSGTQKTHRRNGLMRENPREKLQGGPEPIVTQWSCYGAPNSVGFFFLNPSETACIYKAIFLRTSQEF